MNLVNQKYKYDCGVAAVYNLLQSVNIDYDYFQLKKDLNTTSIWGTFPKNIESFLLNYNKINFNNSVLLVSSDEFYNEKKDDYGHYVNIIGFENDKYKIFDPWDGLYYDYTLNELNEFSSNVLVGKKTRYNNIIFGNLIF